MYLLELERSDRSGQVDFPLRDAADLRDLSVYLSDLRVQLLVSGQIQILI